MMHLKKLISSYFYELKQRKYGIFSLLGLLAAIYCLFMAVQIFLFGSPIGGLILVSAALFVSPFNYFVVGWKKGGLAGLLFFVGLLSGALLAPSSQQRAEKARIEKEALLPPEQRKKLEAEREQQRKAEEIQQAIGYAKSLAEKKKWQIEEKKRLEAEKVANTLAAANALARSKARTAKAFATIKAQAAKTAQAAEQIRQHQIKYECPAALKQGPSVVSNGERWSYRREAGLYGSTDFTFDGGKPPPISRNDETPMADPRQISMALQALKLPPVDRAAKAAGERWLSYHFRWDDYPCGKLDVKTILVPQNGSDKEYYAVFNVSIEPKM